jgi:dTMP kinase
MSWIRGLHEGWSVEPDRTVLLDVPVEVAVDRLEDDRAKFEHREHLEAVHENYRRIAEAEGRVTVVDAARPVEDVVDDVAAVVADTERSGGASSRG